MEYMLVFDQEIKVHKNERYGQIITKNKCYITFVAIERLWHRIKGNKDVLVLVFSFLAFLSFFIFLYPLLCLCPSSLAMMTHSPHRTTQWHFFTTTSWKVETSSEIK